jgi:hypothetical protein
MFAHIPINHHLRPLYRALAGLTGLYILAFGVLGFIQTRGLSLFARDDLPTVLGLRTNPAFAIMSIGAGAVILVATVVGRNIDHWVNLIAGIGFVVVGLAMLALLRTDANILGFSVTNCIVSFAFGIIAFTAGLYGKVGTPEDVEAEDAFRHGH